MTPYDLRAVLVGLVAQAYAGKIDKQLFIKMMKAALEQAMLTAWTLEAQSAHYTGSQYLPQALKAELAAQKKFVAGFAEAVFAAAIKPEDEAAGSKAQIARRIEMWGASGDHFNEMARAVTSPFELVRWHVGPTEHCATCAWLNGQVRSRAWFAERGYRPGVPGSNTECGGFNCQCFFEPVGAMQSTKAMIRDTILTALKEAAFSAAKHPHVPAGYRKGGQFAKLQLLPAGLSPGKIAADRDDEVGGTGREWLHGTGLKAAKHILKEGLKRSYGVGTDTHPDFAIWGTLDAGEAATYAVAAASNTKQASIAMVTFKARPSRVTPGSLRHGVFTYDIPPEQIVHIHVFTKKSNGYYGYAYSLKESDDDLYYVPVILNADGTYEVMPAPTLALKAKQDAAKHPHVPKGSSRGGEFATTGGRKPKAPAMRPVMDDLKDIKFFYDGMPKLRALEDNPIRRAAQDDQLEELRAELSMAMLRSLPSIRRALTSMAEELPARVQRETSNGHPAIAAEIATILKQIGARLQETSHFDALPFPKQLIAFDNAVNQMHQDFPMLKHLVWTGMPDPDDQEVEDAAEDLVGAIYDLRQQPRVAAAVDNVPAALTDDKKTWTLDKPTVFYFGTTKSRFAQLKRNGLNPESPPEDPEHGRRKPLPPAVYLTTDENLAGAQAAMEHKLLWSNANESGGKIRKNDDARLVFKVTVPAGTVLQRNPFGRGDKSFFLNRAVPAAWLTGHRITQWNSKEGKEDVIAEKAYSAAKHPHAPKGSPQGGQFTRGAAPTEIKLGKNEWAHGTGIAAADAIIQKGLQVTQGKFPEIWGTKDGDFAADFGLARAIEAQQKEFAVVVFRAQPRPAYDFGGSAIFHKDVPPADIVHVHLYAVGANQQSHYVRSLKETGGAGGVFYTPVLLHTDGSYALLSPRQPVLKAQDAAKHPHKPMGVGGGQFAPKGGKAKRPIPLSLAGLKKPTPTDWARINAPEPEFLAARRAKDNGEMGKAWRYLMPFQPQATPEGTTLLDIPAKRRQGNCYQMAAEFALENDGWTLVHGNLYPLTGPFEDQPYNHGWAERGDLVYDGVVNKFFLKDQYYANFNPVDLRKYTQHEAQVNLVKHGVWGDWD